MALDMVVLADQPAMMRLIDPRLSREMGVVAGVVDVAALGRGVGAQAALVAVGIAAVGTPTAQITVEIATVALYPLLIGARGIIVVDRILPVGHVLRGGDGGNGGDTESGRGDEQTREHNCLLTQRFQ